MKNLKRVLSMALATVMVMGMMVVGSGAANMETEYADAIAQVKVLGIMEGDENGNFNADKVVTRNEMAVVMANLADLKLNGAHPFNDVPTWAEKYVGALYTNGLTSGTSANTYSGSANITTTTAALMIMKTMGYFEYQGEFGEDWALATVKKATKLNLFDDIDAGVNEGLTRGELAQMIVNALAEYTVTTTEISGMKVEGEGFTVTEKASYEHTPGKLLITKLFGEDLEWLEGEEDFDSFGRPATKYEYDDETETVVNEALAVYAGADFDEDTLKDDFKDYDRDDIEIVYNGGEDANVTMETLEKSRKGYTIEVYGDKDEEIIEKIVVVEYTAAIVDEIETDDDDEVTEVSITVLNPEVEKTLVIDAEENEDAYELIADLDEEDVFAIALAPGWDENDADVDDVILAVDEVETVDGEVTTSKLTDGYNGWIKIDGTKYTMAWIYSGAEVKTESDGTFYLYNGYVIHFDGTTDEDEDEEYAFVLRAGSEKDKWEDMTYFAEVVFADGTTAEIEIDKDAYEMVKAEGYEVVSYEYDEDDEIYSFDEKLENKGAADIKKGKTAVKVGDTRIATANGKTEYIVIELDDGDIDDVTTYSGYKNVASVKTTATWVADDFIFAVYGEAIDADSDDVIYVAVDSKSGIIDDKDLGEYRTVNAIVDGEIVEIMIKKDLDLGAVLFNSAKIDEDEIYTSLSGDVEFTTYVGDFKKAADDVITIEIDEDNEETLAYADDVVVFVIDEDGDIAKGSINRNYSDVTVKVIENDDDEATMIFIEK